VGPNEVQGLGAGRYVRIRLADTGEGMDEATLARATEPFFTTKGVGRGTGLGLSMVQGLAEQSGGRLQIDSRVGGGTTVAIFLPVASEEPAQEVETLPQADAAAPGPMSILAVDDDPLVLANTAAMLEDVGHRVRRAESAESALALLAQAPADLVISDHLMPGMTGLELVRAVRAQSPHQPVLLVSGFAEFEGGEADDLMLLRKPFRQDELLKAVAAATGAPNVVSLFGSRAPPLRG
jgi:CheY-like chemotaxis protein